jgi:putative copper resistance protein D
MTALLVVSALVLVPRSPGARLAALAGSAGALGSLAWTGHANDDEGLAAAAHRIADVAHLLTAGLWLGALPALARALGPDLEGSTDRMVDVVQRFSRVATAAVALLMASGAANAMLIMTGPIDLIATKYGRLLSFKLALAGAMLALAAVNRLQVTPALQGARSVAAARTLRRHCLLELALGVSVLAVVAVLGTISPS